MINGGLKMSKFYNQKQIENLNRDITAHFKHIFPIETNFKTEHEGVSRLVMLDRYSQTSTSVAQTRTACASRRTPATWCAAHSTEMSSFTTS